jgi:hypothetical protein
MISFYISAQMNGECSHNLNIGTKKIEVLSSVDEDN